MQRVIKYDVEQCFQTARMSARIRTNIYFRKIKINIWYIIKKKKVSSVLLYNWNMKSMTRCGECEIKKKKKEWVQCFFTVGIWNQWLVVESVKSITSFYYPAVPELYGSLKCAFWLLTWKFCLLDDVLLVNSVLCMIADHDLVFGRCRNKEPHSSGILCRVVVVGYENRLLGHRLIDSRLFEKILQRKLVENGTRKNAHVPVFRAEMLVTQYVLSSSRHLVTPLIYIYFAFDSGSLSIAGGWRKRGTLLIFCQTVVLVCPLLLQELQEARVKGFSVARFRKLSDSKFIHLAGCAWLCRQWGAQPARLCSGKLACTFSLRTNFVCAKPLLFLASISS